MEAWHFSFLFNYFLESWSDILVNHSGSRKLFLAGHVIMLSIFLVCGWTFDTHNIELGSGVCVCVYISVFVMI